MRRSIGGIGVLVMGMLHAGAAFGSDDTGEPATARPSAWSAQLGLGVGGGNVGFAASGSVSGERWLASNGGVGLDLAAFAQAQTFGTGASALSAIPHVAYRSNGIGSTWFATAGLGYAYVKSTETEFCPLGGPCPPDRHFRGHGYALGFSVGYLHRSERLLIGVGARFYLVNPLTSIDGTETPAAHGLATLNLVVGLTG